MAEQNPPVALTQDKDVRIVELTNSKIIDKLNIAEIGQTLTALIDEVANPKLLLDFGQVDHLSSAALGMLINANGRIKAKNGQLRLANIKPQIFKPFYIHPTRAEALASFK